MAAMMVSAPVMTLRPVRAQRVAAPRPAGLVARTHARRSLAVRATPTQEEKSALETAINNARETCEGGQTGECANAWDDVEELSAAEADRRAKAKKADPLEEYCEDNPDADECRVYED